MSAGARLGPRQLELANVGLDRPTDLHLRPDGSLAPREAERRPADSQWRLPADFHLQPDGSIEKQSPPAKPSSSRWRNTADLHISRDGSLEPGERQPRAPVNASEWRATADIHLAPGDTWVDMPQQRAPVNSSEWRATADIHIGTARAGGTEGMGWVDRPQERAPVNASTWRTTADIHIATGDGWVEAAESPVSPTKSTTWRRTNDLHITRGGSLVEARGPPRRRAEHVVAVPHLRCSASTRARHESGPRPCLHTGERGPHRVRRQQERVAHHERPPPGDGRPGRLRRGEWASEPGEGQRLEAGE
mmetsp:Transcript_25901/g.77343  ORF Transcript_25901/g.77343 Transcript_25901/m.77343 type:complete len:305 (-) Transcript_25901:368-1282(-)